MTYKIETRKVYDGWEARSEATLGETPEGLRILKLRTPRGFRCYCKRRYPPKSGGWLYV